MGVYINIGNAGFQRARNSEYVDKSGLISVVNSTLFTERSFSCVTRCRRFGKSISQSVRHFVSMRETSHTSLNRAGKPMYRAFRISEMSHRYLTYTSLIPHSVRWTGKDGKK